MVVKVVVDVVCFASDAVESNIVVMSVASSSSFFNNLRVDDNFVLLLSIENRCCIDEETPPIMARRSVYDKSMLTNLIFVHRIMRMTRILNTKPLNDDYNKLYDVI